MKPKWRQKWTFQTDQVNPDEKILSPGYEKLNHWFHPLTSFWEILEYPDVNDKIDAYRGQNDFRSVCSPGLYCPQYEIVVESFSSSCTAISLCLCDSHARVKLLKLNT